MIVHKVYMLQSCCVQQSILSHSNPDLRQLSRRVIDADMTVVCHEALIPHRHQAPLYKHAAAVVTVTTSFTVRHTCLEPACVCLMRRINFPTVFTVHILSQRSINAECMPSCALQLWCHVQSESQAATRTQGTDSAACQRALEN